MPFPLLQTKLYVPPPRPQLVARPAITTKLHASAAYPLTLIAAPAGFGKTTLVSEWITLTEQPVAWLSLDEEDDDPGRFLLYLVAALRSIHPRIGETTLASLQAPQLPPLTALLTPLLNDLSQLSAPFALVLDDYHLITVQSIHDALTFFVEHLPPTLRLIMTTRLDPPLPLARWRVRGQLAEVRADDLRFGSAEAATFFNQVMGLDLTADDIARLEARTEGWIAGLQLAALSMQGRADITGFIQSFSGSHRHVFSYLIDEVLNQRPAGTLDFLLQTALLERFNADLCNAVTERNDSQALLERIEQANLFLIPLDDERKWYRYHHLFAEVLRTHLHQTAPQTIPALHQRAAAWFEAQELVPEAVRHALAADDFAKVAHLVERIGIALLSQPSVQSLLESWLVALPANFIGTRPRLCLIYAWFLFMRHDLLNASYWLEKADAARLQDSPQVDNHLAEQIAGEIAVIHAVIAAYQPNPALSEALTWGRQALATLKDDQAAFRSIAAGAVGSVYMKQGNVVEAEQALAEANRMAQASRNVYALAAAATNQSNMQRVQGAQRRAFITCQAALAWMIGQRVHSLPIVGTLYLALADLQRERNELALAQEHATVALTHLLKGISPHVLIFGHLVLLRVLQAQGQWAQAREQVRKVATLAEQHPTVIHRTLLSAISAQFDSAENSLALDLSAGLTKAYQWAQSHGWAEEPLTVAHNSYDLIFMLEHSRLARAQIFIAWAHRTQEHPILHETLAYLQRQEQMAADSHLGWYRIKLQVLQALVHSILGQSAVALSMLTVALQHAEPEGYVRIFVDEGEPMRLLLTEWTQSDIDDGQLGTYVNQLLMAFMPSVDQQRNAKSAVQTETPSPTIVKLVEPLSERELEILHLVANGLSNSQLADKLIVTVGTVKKHLNNIYGKLGVASRTQAIGRGRELGLLTD